MDYRDFGNSPRGHLVPVEGAQAFVPEPLPREVTLESRLVYLLDRASMAVARLDGVGETVPDTGLLIAPFTRREAVLSSRIEGIQATVSDVYAAEVVGRSRADVQEASNYLQALQRGLELLDDLPICAKLVRELHGVLLAGVRGGGARPGELRTIQAWIGSPGSPIEDARFVPPPPRMLGGLLSDWEAFVNDRSPLPALVRSALMHYQFEAIHPFRDGNGRVGRLLIPLMLRERGVLKEPLLYLSAYFERHRQRYYDGLYGVSATGDWTPWLEFFLAGVREQAEDAVDRARRLRDLQDDHRRRLQEIRASANAMRLADGLFIRPVITARSAAQALGVSDPGARKVIERLSQAQILRPMPDSYPQEFHAEAILDLLD